MAKQFKTPIAPPALTSDPAGTTVGEIYYNIPEETIKVYNGTVWNAISAGGTNSNMILLDGGSASSTYLETYDGGDASGN